MSRFEGIQVYDITSTVGTTMRFLGTVRLIAGTYFVDSTTQRFVVNWNNKIPKVVITYNTSTGNFTSSSASVVEFNSGAGQVRGEFLSLTTNYTLMGSVTSYINAALANERSQIGVGFNSVNLGSGWAG